MGAKVIQADRSHLEALLPLFNAYREFYKQVRDEQRARDYLNARMAHDDAVIFLAAAPGEPARYSGFVLLYPTFDSVEMSAIWVLHDLFVDPEFRRQGVARMLMNSARDYCRQSGATRIDLATAIDNVQAQPLYESLGYARDTEFFSYSLDISGTAE